MRVSAARAPTSLERLKALDSLAGLPSQLAEAKLLCSHSARAEMILKWLLEKLKTSEEACVSAAAWDLLSSTFRLLHSERLANLLGTFDFYKVVPASLAALAHNNDGIATLLAISACLNLLLEKADGAKGAALKAYLSVDAANAAHFVALWLKNAYRIVWSTANDLTLAARYSLLDSPLHIWDMRKRSAGESQVFAQECLASVAAWSKLLDASGTNAGTRKRKRDYDQHLEEKLVTYQRLLASMLAKHIFLPARTAFLQTLDDSSRIPTSKTDWTWEDRDLDLDGRLQALRSTAGEEITHTQDDIRPVLLDIALRCTPQHLTPRQKLRERSWVEAAFAALLGATDERSVTSSDVVQRMLRTIRDHHASLSRGYINELLDKFGKPRAPSNSVNWSFVAEIIRLDPAVYIDPDRAVSLFYDISESVSKRGPPLTNTATENMEAPHNHRRDHIIIPIMEAFARNRDLIGFVELWHDQLERKMPPQQTESVWFDLAQAFGSLVEISFSGAQVRELMIRHHKIIKSALADNVGSEEGHTKLVASITILDAVLDGIRSPDLQDSIFEEIHDLIHDLLFLSADDSVAQNVQWQKLANLKQAWALLRKAFNLEFPLWLTQQSDRDNILARVIDISVSAPVQRVETFIQSVRQDKSSTRAARKAALEAERFVLTLSPLFSYNTDIASDLLGLRDRVIRQLPISHIHILVDHPRALADMSGEVRNDALLQWLKDAILAIDQNLGPAATTMENLRAIIATAIAQSQTNVIEDIVRATLTVLTGGRDGEPPSTTELLLSLQILAELPAISLTMNQRERIINGVVSLDHSWNHRDDILQLCLVVAVGMLECPCPGADILTDSKILWHLADQAHNVHVHIGQEMHPDTGGIETGVLLERLVKLVLKHLLTTQTQERPRSMIIALYRELMTYLKQTSWVSEGAHRRDFLTVVKTLLLQSSRLRRDLAKECMDVTVLQSFAERLLDEAISTSEQGRVRSDPASQESLGVLLDALLSVPLSSMADESFSTRIAHFIVSAVMTGGFAESLAGTAEPIAETLKHVFIKCLQTSSLGDSPINRQIPELLVTLSVSLLDSGIQPRHHAELLSAFGQVCRTFDARTKIQVLGQLLSDCRRSQSLQLLQTTLSALDRDDFSRDESTPGYTAPQVALQQVLHIAAEAKEVAISKMACYCIVTILKEKPFMTNQYTIEATVATLRHLAQHSQFASVLYLDVCRIFTVLLQQYRPRLMDRLNIMTELLQKLISCLFCSAHSPAARPRGLKARHAKVLARLLQLLCNPPQLHNRAKASNLVDEARKAQAHVGQYVQYVLHHYCSQVLNGTLAEGVGDVLMPALWAIIEAIEVNDADGVKALSAAMTNSERAVLRGIYEDYKNFGKWRGE